MNEPANTMRINMERSYSLFPPPRLMPNGELRAIIEPPLRDLVPFPGSEMVEEWEPFESGRSEYGLTPELVHRAQSAALADGQVKRMLAEKRYIAIGASLLEKRDEPQATALLFVIYNYGDNATIEVTLDAATLQVTDVTTANYQPPPLQTEIDEAVALARKDHRLERYSLDNLEATAILVSDSNPDSPNFGHRIFDVRFGCADERLPRHMALVDLSTETILAIDADCGAHPTEGGRS